MNKPNFHHLNRKTQTESIRFIKASLAKASASVFLSLGTCRKETAEKELHKCSISYSTPKGSVILPLDVMAVMRDCESHQMVDVLSPILTASKRAVLTAKASAVLLQTVRV